MFEASNVALQFVTSLRRLVEIIAERDANLGSQLWRAATSAALNTAEAGRRVGRDKRHRAGVAAAECDEAVTALRIGVAWGWLAEEELATPLALADRLQAILWRLGHPRR